MTAKSREGRKGLYGRALRAGKIAAATLREIFDESAYTRFLAREGVGESRESYAAFLRERTAQSERRPRCC